jgi:hypothetical protein
MAAPREERARVGHGTVDREDIALEVSALIAGKNDLREVGRDTDVLFGIADADANGPRPQGARVDRGADDILVAIERAVRTDNLFHVAWVDASNVMSRKRDG